MTRGAEKQMTKKTVLDFREMKRKGEKITVRRRAWT
jgi:hypothetical protein